jgi:hypothetical protein
MPNKKANRTRDKNLRKHKKTIRNTKEQEKLKKQRVRT